jgi:hypothetical protein
MDSDFRVRCGQRAAVPLAPYAPVIDTECQIGRRLAGGSDVTGELTGVWKQELPLDAHVEDPI